MPVSGRGKGYRLQIWAKVSISSIRLPLFCQVFLSYPNPELFAMIEPAVYQFELLFLARVGQCWKVCFLSGNTSERFSCKKKQVEFANDTVDLLWLDNTNTEDYFKFTEAKQDNRNPPDVISNCVNIKMSTNATGANFPKMKLQN